MGDVFFFFFKQKTAYEITEGDWSSDVCSSDLAACSYVPELARAGRWLQDHVFSRSEPPPRSEERRVGKECPPLCRSRWSPYHLKKNNTKAHHNHVQVTKNRLEQRGEID